MRGYPATRQKHCLCFFLFFSLIMFLPLSQSRAGDFWQINSLSFLHGSDYKLGEATRNIMTYEHTDGWKYGDTFFFTDLSFLDENKTEYYAELQPRFSLSKISGKKFSYGMVDDILIATQMEFGSHDVRTYLYGLGADLKIPGFTFLNVEAYVRDNAYLPGATYQFTTAWDRPFVIANSKWTITGFVDWAGGEDQLSSNVIAAPQLLLDIGNYWNLPGKLYGGIEYQYWHNKFGVHGVDEHAPQAMVKFFF